MTYRFVDRNLYKRLLIIGLVLIITFNSFFVPKADSFFQFVIGGVAVGEALFYTAATLAAGYGLYEAYNSFTTESISSKFFKQAIGKTWSNMSSTAKAGWASLEEGARGAAATVTLGAEQWSQAFVAGLMAFSTSRTIVPAIPLPGDLMNPGEVKYFTVTNDFHTSYGILDMSMNGVQFSLMPYVIQKPSFIKYQWYSLQNDGTWMTNNVPSAASAFAAPYMQITVTGNHDFQPYFKSFDPLRISGLSYGAPSWDDLLIKLFDGLPLIHSYLLSVYGGLAVSVPATWPGVPAIPGTKDVTKPVPIPIPTGALTVPGSLTLNPADVTTSIKTMTGDMAIPDTGIIDTIKDFFDLTKPIDWSPIRSVPQVATKAFPFSLPWDVGRAIDVLTVTGKRPEFEVTVMVNGQAVKREVPFGDFMDPFVPYIRSGIVFLFTFGLIFATRKLFGGAK